MTNLPVPVPAQEAPGNFITSALWNANVYNGLTFLLNPPLFVGTQANSQSIPDQSWTTISLDSTIVDSYGGHSNTTNNSRYTAPVAGWYTICGMFWTISVSSASYIRAVRILVNGSAVTGHEGYNATLAGFESCALTPTKDVYLNAGDYVELSGWQGSGGSLGTHIGPNQSTLYVRFSHA